MSELVDRSVIKLPPHFFENIDNVPKFYEWLNSLPTIEAVPGRHGQWIDMEIGDGIIVPRLYKCSVCEGTWSGVGGYIYCPRCGARMDGKEI